MTSSLVFPPDFVFGSATAAYQIEGAAQVDGRTDSIWDAFARVPGNVAGGEDGSLACDHYHRMPEDVALMAELGLGTYRFSTSWARVKPDDGPVNPKGIDFYSRLVDELLGAGIAPWLTLYHWDLPQALQERGGWANRETAERFADYAEDVFAVLGDRVPTWTTLNEPWCSAFLGCASGEHAPGHQNPREAVAAAHHLLLGHGLAVERLRSGPADVRVGITLNPAFPEAADPDSAGDRDAVRRLTGVQNRIFLDPLFRGAYPADLLEDLAPFGIADHIRDGDLAIISHPIDVLGVNYYSGSLVSVDPAQAPPGGGEPARSAAGKLLATPHPGTDDVHVVERGLPRTAMGWEVEPRGFRELLLDLHRDYTGPAGVPMVITENGAAYDDAADPSGFVDDSATRLAYIRGHLQAVHAALAAGADIGGYLVWSLLDNFEWAWGYDKRFGIVRVDYETLARTPKASARWFADVARTRTVPLGQ